MKKFVAIILLLSFTLSACSHVLPKYQNESKTDFYSRINKLTQDKIVSLKLGSDKAFDCKELQVNSDSTFYRDLHSNELRSVGTAKIISISFYNGARGAWEGLLFGSLIGGVAGLIPNFILPKGAAHPSGNPFLIIYGALAGAIIGVVYGSFNESMTTIEFGN